MSASSAPSDAASAAPSRAGPVVLLCFAAVLISYLDRTNISVAAIAMQEDLGWDEATKGIVLSSFFVGYVLLQVVAGTLANRFGGRIVLGAAVLWWSAFTALTPPAAAASFGLLIAARIALGLGEAAVFPGSINMIGRWVPAAQRSRAVALFSSAQLCAKWLATIAQTAGVEQIRRHGTSFGPVASSTTPRPSGTSTNQATAHTIPSAPNA